MYLFSYGVAKDRFENVRLNETILTGKFKLDTSGMFKVLRYSDKLNSIEGYLIEISKKELEELDKFEDYPRTYNRILINIDGVEAWVYIENEKDMK